MRFDQLLRDAEDGAIDEGVMTAMLGKVCTHTRPRPQPQPRPRMHTHTL